MRVEELKLWLEEITEGFSEGFRLAIAGILAENKDKSKEEIVNEIIESEFLDELYPEEKQRLLEMQGWTAGVDEEFKERVLVLLAKGQKKEATEELVNWIKSTEHIFTTRDDKNPEIWIYRGGIYVPDGKSYIKEKVRKILGTAYNIYLANEVIHKIMADTFIEPKVFFSKDSDPRYLPVRNGILDLLTGEIMPFTPEKIFFNKLPVKYDPEADCPHIRKFFLDVLENESDLPVIQEIFGFVLWREYFIPKMIMLIGSGRNGKSTTLELIKRFLGAENVCSIQPQDLESKEFILAELHNKMANLAPDIDSRSLRFTGRLKSTTGKDLITANRKFKSPVYFVNYAKHIFGCNELPKTYDKSLAFWNRWILLNFPYKFLSKKEIEELPEDERSGIKEADPNILDKITSEEEMSGLLNWAIKGLHRLLKNKDFSYSKTTDEVRKMWVRKSDSFQAFLMDCCESEWNATISKKDLRRAYANYCKKHKLKTESDKHIKAVLEETWGVSEDRVSIEGVVTRIWEGIKLKPECEELLKSNGSVGKESVDGEAGIASLALYSEPEEEDSREEVSVDEIIA